MSIREVQQKITRREYRMYLAWLENQWNQPDRSDYYRMQIAMEVRSVLLSFARGSKAPNMNDFKLQFHAGGEEAEELAKHRQQKKEKAAAVSKLVWAARLGMRPK